MATSGHNPVIRLVDSEASAMGFADGSCVDEAVEMWRENRNADG